MSMTVEDVDLRDSIENAIPCEGSEHPKGTLGHDGGPARFVIYSPCRCKPNGRFQCAGRAAAMRWHPSGRLACGTCRQGFPIEQWRFEPI